MINPESNQDFPRQMSRAFEAKSMKVAVGKEKNEG